MRPIEPSRRRWNSSTAGLAVLLALGVLIGGAVETGAQPAAVETAEAGASEPARRFPVNDPTIFKPGYFFTLVKKSANPGKRELERQTEILRQVYQTEKPFDFAMELNRQVGADANARAMVGSLDGVFTTIIIIQAQVAIHKNDKAGLDEGLRNATNIVHFPNGARIPISVVSASYMHMANLRLASAVLRELPAGQPLAASYNASVTGDCPFDAGPLTITQQEFVVEGARDGRLLLMGALGRSTAYFIANELPYGSIGKTPTGQPLLEAPDRPSELYEAQLGSERLTLSGQIFKECEIVLTP